MTDSDTDYHNSYLNKKKKLRELHKRLRETKEVQEIYHKIMGSSEDSDRKEGDSSFDDDLL